MTDWTSHLAFFIGFLIACPIAYLLGRTKGTGEAHITGWKAGYDCAKHSKDKE